MPGGTAQDWQNVGPYGVYRRTGGDYLFLWRCRSDVQRGAAGVASTCQVLFVRRALISDTICSGSICFAHVLFGWSSPSYYNQF